MHEASIYKTFHNVITSFMFFILSFQKRIVRPKLDVYVFIWYFIFIFNVKSI